MSNADILKVDDLLAGGQWRSPKLVIEAVIEPGELKSADGKTVDLPVLRFADKAKLLIINKTNQRLLRLQIGSANHAEWAGVEISIYAALLADAFGEKNVPAIRIRPPASVPIPMGVRRHLGKDLTGKVSK